MARRTFGLGIPTLSENSFTPVARITFASATFNGTPSSTAAVRNWRANSGFRRSSANPSFQSLARLAIFHLLQVLGPELSCAFDVLRLRFLVPAQQEQNNLAAGPPKVETVPGPEVEPRLPD